MPAASQGPRSADYFIDLAKGRSWSTIAERFLVGAPTAALGYAFSEGIVTLAFVVNHPLQALGLASAAFIRTVVIEPLGLLTGTLQFALHSYQTTWGWLGIWSPIPAMATIITLIFMVAWASDALDRDLLTVPVDLPVLNADEGSDTDDEN